MTMKVVLVAFAAFVVVTGDDHFCCTPDQWEGYQGVIAGDAFPHYSKLKQSAAKISYDAGKQMVAVTAHVLDNGKYNSYHVLMDFQHKKSFTVHKKICVVKPFLKPFKRTCVPGDAKPTGAYTMGVGSNSVTADYFHIHVQHFNGHISFVASVAPIESESEKDSNLCVPVSETLHGVYYGHHQQMHFLNVVGFSNITAGIADEHVFDVPKECTRAELRRNYRLKFDINLETKSFFGY